MTNELLFEQGAMMVINDEAGEVAVFEIDITKPNDAYRTLDTWGAKHNLDLDVAEKKLSAFIETETLFAKIAREQLSIGTLRTRNMDSLDFHEVAVTRVREALRLAYLAGQKSAEA